MSMSYTYSSKSTSSGGVGGPSFSQASVRSGAAGGGAGAARMAYGGAGVGGSLGLGSLGGSFGGNLGQYSAAMGGAGQGIGLGWSGSGAGMGLSYGAAGVSPAFSMGRNFASGGLSGTSALAVRGSMGALMGPNLTRDGEKQMLAMLNNRFSAYLTKVQELQQENAVLEARLSQLTGGTDMSPDASTTTTEYEAQLVDYRTTLENLTLDTIRLEIDLDNVRGAAHELKAKFDFEQGVRYQLEADIASMKKDIEMASDLKVELEARYASLKTDLDYLTKTQGEELAGLQSKLGPSTVDTSSVAMIAVDTDRSFDIADALARLREQYEKSVHQHKEEADAYYRIKMDEIQTATAKSTEAIGSAKLEIAAAKKDLQGLGLELQALLTTHGTLEQSLAEAQAQSTVGVSEYQAQLASLNSAIEVAKGELKRQILAYQELLDIKLALDVEISNYRRLLEGIELKMSDSFTSGTFYGGGTSGINVVTTETSAIYGAEDRD